MSAAIDIIDRLHFDAVRCEAQFSKGVAGNIREAADEIKRLTAENAGIKAVLNWKCAENERLKELLGAIERNCDDEIKARFPPHHCKTEEELAGKSVIYHMLAMPRNIARRAHEQKADDNG